MSGRRFRIALTFAGEKRDFVGAVAGILAERFGKDAILYEKYHQAEFSRASHSPSRADLDWRDHEAFA